MPGSAVHKDFFGVSAQNDAVIAENFDAGLTKPQAGSGALPRARMAQKKMPAAIFVHDPDGVDFNAVPAGEAMDHQHFVERILQRINRTIVRKELAREHDMTGFEIAVEPR